MVYLFLWLRRVLIYAMQKKIIITICIICSFIWLISAQAKISLTNRVVGITGSALTNVESLLQSQQESLGGLTPEKISTFYQEIPNQIKTALAPYGYFTPIIRSEIFQRGENYYINYFIKLGSSVKIKKINFTVSGEGSNDPQFKAIENNFPLRVGDILETDKYEAVKKLLFDTAANTGYLDAVLHKKEIKVDLANLSAEITLSFDTGMRYYFGNINFSKSPFSEKFLNKFSNFKSGEPYSNKKVEQFHDILSNSNFFQEVVLDKNGIEKNGHFIPVNVDLIPKKSRQYSFGLGYGTDTGVRGLLGLELRHLTSDGQSFKSNIKASQVASAVEAHYLIPGKDPVKDLYDFSVGYQMINQDFGSSHSSNIAAGYITMLQKWQQTLKLSLVHETYKINDDPQENSLLLVPSANWLRSETDNLIKPNKGYNVNFKIQGASNALFSTTNFVQGYFNGKYIYPLTDTTPIVMRGTIGYTAIKNIDDLPLTFQYFAGGMQSVRGYSYNAIGPGRDLTVGSIELRQETIEDLYATVFIDAGNATESFMPELKKSIGVGALYRSPVGLIQLSYARAINESGQPGKIQFSIGPEF